MTRTCYRVISCEGGDQVGKADTILNLRENFLKNGISTTYSSFPIYATPIGTTLRRILMNGFDGSRMGVKEKIVTKMALYSLNRLEFLDVVLSSEKYSKTVMVLDRSSFSSAVTIGYALSTEKSIVMKDADNLVDIALDLDALMIKKLNLKNCVVELVSLSDEWNNIRSDERDRHENRDAQLLSKEVYKIYARKIGKGWGKVVTKDEKGWRQREDILQEMLYFTKKRFGNFDLDLSARNFEIGAKEIIEDMYVECDVDSSDLDIYSESILKNDKDTMYEYACKIGTSIAETSKGVKFCNDEVKESFTKIVERYPMVFDIIESCVGENYVRRVQEALK